MQKKTYFNMFIAMLLILTLGFGTSVDATSSTVTRGEFVKALISDLEVELGDGSSITFKDVNKDLAPYVEKAVELNLVKGKTSEVFAPEEQLTRVHAFSITARGLTTENASLVVLNAFKDKGSIGKANQQDMANAASLKITLGYNDGTLRPYGKVTEKDMQRIVERFAERYKDKEGITLRILGTTDLHTNLANYNYYLDTESSEVGLANTATLIDEARKENQNTILLDNGDLIQGTPLGSYKALENKLKDGEVHPSVAALNALQYDVATLGNHEFNYGLEYLDEVMDDAKFTWVNANVYDAKTGKHYFKPYTILNKEVVDGKGNKYPIKIGVTGIVPTQILGWDALHLTGKVTAEEPLTALKKVIPQMEKAGADIVVVLAHSGIGSDQYVDGVENIGYQITELDGVHALITGHSHAQFPGDYQDLANVDQEKGTINGVPTVMAGAYGSHLGVIDLKLKLVGNDWIAEKGTGEIRSIEREDLKPSPVVLDAVKEAHEGTLEYINKPVGQTKAPITSYFSMVNDDASIQVVTQAQTWYIKEQLKGTADANLPILSAGAPFKAGSRNNPSDYTNISAGPLAIKNMADIYHYDNTVATVKLTGAEVIEWLEMAAGIFAKIDPNVTTEQNIIDAEARSYNFDVLDGVTYEIDVTSPAKYDRRGNVTSANANRIKNVKYNGQPIDLKQEFILVSNNYRVGGSYGANFVKSDQSNLTVYAFENRQAIIDYIIAEGTINPSADNNWNFASFPANTKIVYFTSKNAQQYIPANSNIKYIEDTENGFAKYSLN